MYRLIFIVLLFSPLAHADSFRKVEPVEAEVEEEFRLWMEDYYKKPMSERLKLEWNLSGRVRHEDRDTGDVTRVQPRAQLKAVFDVTSDGCLKAVGSLGTGPNYASRWDDIPTGTRDADYNLNVDSFYLDYALCNIENLHIEGGAMLNNNVGILGPDSDGYIDGLRVRYTTPTGHTKWVVTLGHLDDLETRNFFERDFGEINFKRVTLDHKLNQKLKIISDVIRHMDNLYIRAGASLNIKDNTKYFDEVHFENGWVEGSQQSMILRFKKNYEKWAFALSASRIEDFQGTGTRIPIDSFFGNGRNGKARNNVQLKVSWDMYKNCDWVARIRAGQSPTRTELGFVCKN